MQKSLKDKINQLTLAIHSTNDSFSFALRYGFEDVSDKFFIKKFDKDLCNNLIVDFAEFTKNEDLKKIEKISVSLGPANFNASRLIVVLARTLSQQINCQLDSFSSFEVMAKRIALKNNLSENKDSFWIFKKLKTRGYIAGKYEINSSDNIDENFSVNETITPKLFDKLQKKDHSFQAEYDDIEDLKELLNLSNKILKSSKSNSWETVVPLYPLSPVN